jgi:hypothetical protein
MTAYMFFSYEIGTSLSWSIPDHLYSAQSNPTWHRMTKIKKITQFSCQKGGNYPWKAKI